MPDNDKEILIALAGGITVFLLLAGIIILFLFRYLKRRFLYRQQLAELKLKNEEEILKAKLETQEETLGKVARELHDNIGQLINSAKMLVGLTQRSLGQYPETLDTADQTLSKASVELRSLARSLSSEWLEQFNFLENLHTEIERIRASGHLLIQFSTQTPILLNADKQIMLFRIVQELLQNIIKHAQATVVTISINQDQSFLKITVADNGRGMEGKADLKGMGIANVRYRARLLAGEARWHSQPHHGTQVTVLVPHIESEGTAGFEK